MELLLPAWIVSIKKTVYKKIDFEIKLLTFVLEIRINKIKAVNVNTIFVELKY